MRHSIYPANLNNIHSQRGWTIWSMMFVMGVLFIAAYIGMNLVPIYSANEAVQSSMYQSVEGKDLSKVTRRQIINDMDKQLYIDGKHGLINYKNQVKMVRTRSKFVLEVTYEREVPLVANLVLMARFNPKVECELTGRCDK